MPFFTTKSTNTTIHCQKPTIHRQKPTIQSIILFCTFLLYIFEALFIKNTFIPAMKKNISRIILSLLFVICIVTMQAQGTWTQKASLNAYTGREMATGFSIGNFGYIGTGQTTSGFVDDFWKWDQTNNTWTQVANYAGAGRYGITSFVINGMGYSCFGWSGSYNATDLWQYNPNTNVWTQKANFPGLGRYGSFVFVIGTKAYIGCGEPNSQPGYLDVWCYDAIANTWTQIANFPGGDRSGTIGFALNGKGICRLWR